VSIISPLSSVRIHTREEATGLSCAALLSAFADALGERSNDLTKRVRSTQDTELGKLRTARPGARNTDPNGDATRIEMVKSKTPHPIEGKHCTRLVEDGERKTLAQRGLLFRPCFLRPIHNSVALVSRGRGDFATHFGREPTHPAQRGPGDHRIVEPMKMPKKQSSQRRPCLRCEATMVPSSLGMARLRLTPPGRSRLRTGVEADVYVCPSCGQVDIVAARPEAFETKEGATRAPTRRR
jgi:hypothetical protein